MFLIPKSTIKLNLPVQFYRTRTFLVLTNYYRRAGRKLKLLNGGGGVFINISPFKIKNKEARHNSGLFILFY